MALSFEDSLKNSTATTTEDGGISLMSASAVAESEDSNVVAYASTYASDETWQRHPKYVSYDYFSDDNISTISNKKDLNLDSSQFNIQQ